MTPPGQPQDPDAGNLVPGIKDLGGTWMQEIVPFGIFTTDTDLRIASWNPWLAEYSGYASAEVIGRRLTEIYPDLEKRRLLERFNRALKGEISLLSAALHKYLLPMSPVSNDLQVAHMLQTARIAPLTNQGRTVGTVTMIEDVTQREVQSAILHRQQELDRLLSSALGALIQSSDPAKDITEIFPALMPSLGLDVYFSYLLGARGTVLHLNAAGGVTPKQRESMAVLPIEPNDVVHASSGRTSIGHTVEAHERVLQGIGVRGHCCFPLVLGERVIGLVSFGSYQSDEIPESDVHVLSRIAQYVAIALDRSMRERDIILASRAKDDFLAALSHELRTPLNPVLLLASDCATNLDYPEGAREAFRVIEKNALLEARLIDDLLDLTRIEHGKMNLESKRVDLHAVVKDALVTVRSEATGRQQVLEVELNAASSTTFGDSARLQQVFWNVLKNAIKFTPAGGRIRAESWLEAGDQEIAVRITDTGIGMEAHEVERVFGAFAQGDHASGTRGHRFGGLGLGLAISRKLVELHSGRIEAASRGRDQGASFTVRLPLATSTQTSAGSNSGLLAAKPVVGTSSFRSAGRLLLVEDHEPTRTPMTKLLMKRGYEVVAVGTAHEALAAAATATFDLVLSDIGLPDADGFTLMAQLRSRYGAKGVALTGYGMEEDMARSNEAGFIAHLTKPISIALLDRTLAAIFARTPGPTE